MKYVKQLTLFQHLLRRKKSDKKAALLGLDVGNKFVGLSVSDPSNKIAIPVGVLERSEINFALMASDFQHLISNLSLAGFVFGCPYERNQQTCEVFKLKGFVENLRQTQKFDDVKFTFWNECFSSSVIFSRIELLDLHPIDEKTILDKFAALSILQEYLDFVNRMMELDAQK